jgi:hypothetical protein
MREDKASPKQCRTSRTEDDKKAAARGEVRQLPQGPTSELLNNASPPSKPPRQYNYHVWRESIDALGITRVLERNQS